jgi:hypothetical protein
MPYDDVNSAGQLRDELASLIRRYVQHLDFEAPTEITTVRIEATGPALSVIYAEQPDQQPMLQVSINTFLREPRP